MIERFPITDGGYRKMEEELRTLKVTERPTVIQAIAEARAHGDLSENAEYHAAREKQSFIEGRISELEDKLARAEVIDISTLSGDTVKFGAIVKLVDDDDREATYQIVSEYEADLDNFKISITSPIARALIGKIIGDYVEVQTPKGTKGYEVLGVTFGK